MTANRGWGRWGVPLGLAAGVVVLAVVALVRDPVQLDPDSPEGTVQEYLEAINERDWNRAYELLDPEEFTECTPADIEETSPRNTFTATLQRTEQALPEPPGEPPGLPGDEATVEVSMRFGEPGLFSSGFTNQETFFLVSRDDFWWISGDPWPHFQWRCN